MKKSKFFAWPSLTSVALLAATLLMGSCAVDGFDDETFSGGVTGQNLNSPSADDISFTANADGSKTTIEWPLVYGAGGYLCSVIDVSDPNNPVVLVEDSVVDGTVMTVDRTEDTNYEFHIRTLGNEELSNTDAEATTVAPFSSFMPGWATVPDGSDLTQWLAANPLPTDQGEVAIDLVAGGHYTMSGNVDFGKVPVTLRTTNKNDRATLTPATGASIVTMAGLKLKNLVIDGSQVSKSLILMSAEPDPSIQNLKKDKGYYYVEDPIVFNNCLVDNLAGEVINSNKTKYIIKTMLIDNSVFHFNTASGHSSGSYFNMYDGGAGINDFTARQSTFYNSSDQSMKYMLRYQNSTSPKNTGYNKGSVNFIQCTLFNIVKGGQFANYDGMRRTGDVTFTLDRNIIVDTGNKEFVRRFTGGSAWDQPAGNKNFTMNTYFFDGADAWTMPDPADEATWTGEASWDRSGSILSGDPGFKDAMGGDFTVSGSAQLGSRTGDPRWLPTE